MSLLVGKLSKKKQKLIDDLVSEHYQLFVSVAKKIVRSRADAEDVVQKSLIYIVKKVAEDKKIHNIVGYTIVAIRCRAINYLRDHKREKEIQSIEDIDIDYKKIRKIF